MKLTRDDLLSLEAYSEQRNDFRAHVMAHKKPRNVRVGDHLTFLFEDRLTIQYQIQEMLRAERIFEAAAIQEELDTYNPLIPDGNNLKATLLIEYEDVDERRQALVRLRGIENKLELQVGKHPPVRALANEDLERGNDEKTTAVHFLRFELDPSMIADWRQGVEVTLRSTHPELQVASQLRPAQQKALTEDFE
ncbi:MAG: DUF3501 family protein [Rhodanobacteraceae bacterium]